MSAAWVPPAGTGRAELDRLVREAIDRSELNVRVKRLEATALVAPTLAANWSNFSATFQETGYYKQHGRVYLQGLIKKSVAVVASETVFTLPDGFRPAATSVHVAISNGAIGRVDVLATGAVQIAAGNAVYVSFDGISFPVV